MPKGRIPDELSKLEHPPTASSNGHRVVEATKEVTSSVTVADQPRRNHTRPSRPKWRLRRQHDRSDKQEVPGKRRFLSRMFKKPGRRMQSSRSRGTPKKTRYTKTGTAIRWALYGLLFFFFVAAVRTFATAHKMTLESHARTASDARIEAQLKELGVSSTFPLADAEAKARRMAYECFTVPNTGSAPDSSDKITMQDHALANAGVPAGDNINCGWNGHGRGKVDDMQVVKDPYWIQSGRATIIVQIKLYQRPGYFYYYVPFTNDNGVAKFAGMPAVFGTASGAESFLTTCDEPVDSVNTDPLKHTAQLFLNALTGKGNLDLGYLTYEGAKFGGFGPAVSAPKVVDAKYCGRDGQEKRFAVMVKFSGPVEGSHYTLPYAFSVVPNPQTSGKYQVKDFGPAAGYHGS